MGNSVLVQTASQLWSPSNGAPRITAITEHLCNVELYNDNSLSTPYVIVGGLSYLTTKFKRYELKKLRREIARKRVDRHMIPYLNKLNAIKGVCSQFCCMGHVKESRSTTGNILFYVDFFAHQALMNNWQSITHWPECVEVSTGHHNMTLRWMFHWKVTRRRSYYREFLGKLIPNLKKWIRQEIIQTGS